MKTSKLILTVSLFGLVFTSCQNENNVQTTVVDFENVTLNSDSIWNGSDLTGSFISGNSTFMNSYNASWASWTGFSCSSKTDSVTTGYANQYSVIAASGALGSKKFAIAYDSAAISIPKTFDYYTIKSLYITNSTYAYHDIKNGSNFSKKFASGDWFKVIIKGYKGNTQTGSIDVYLADFRNGRSTILKTWEKVDLSALGQVDLVTFTFDSTDKTAGWINTPTYACIDNIEFTQTITTK